MKIAPLNCVNIIIKLYTKYIDRILNDLFKLMWKILKDKFNNR